MATYSSKAVTKYRLYARKAFCQDGNGVWYGTSPYALHQAASGQDDRSVLWLVACDF